MRMRKVSADGDLRERLKYHSHLICVYELKISLSVLPSHQKSQLFAVHHQVLDWLSNTELTLGSLLNS